MIKLKEILKEITNQILEEKVPNKIYDFINKLTTDDIGKKDIDDYIIYYEGYTDDCWLDFNESGKTIRQLENEMVSEWKSELNDIGKYKFIESNWNGLDNNIYYAIFKKIDNEDISPINEVNKSTLAVRRFYKRHPRRVREYLKKTQKDRIRRNRDRRRAISKHGKSFMRDKDVHHPNGVNGGKTKIVKSKNHGPDKKNKGKNK